MATTAQETHPRLGGTDGFRGEFDGGDAPGRINAETFAGLTAALIYHQQDMGLDGPIVVGYDGPGRQGGEELKASVIQGALACGVEVIDLGIAPTPVIQHAAGARRIGAMAAVSITASHNPAHHNGWKGMLGNRKPATGEMQDISDRYWDMQDSSWRPIAMQKNAYEYHPDYVQYTYARAVIRDIEQRYGQRPLADTLFVVDGANGAATELTPKIFRRLGAEVVEFACDRSGAINDNCGAADLEGVQAFMLSRNELLDRRNFIGAVANDGDADRMMAIGAKHTSAGTELVTLDGNHAMWAIAQGEPGIVGTEYTNSGLVRRLQAAKVDFEYCDNGDAFVTRRLHELQAEGKQWRRGGEFTGHHIDTDWLPSGDGVRMAALYAAHAVSRGMTFADLHDELPLWDELIGKVKVSDASLRKALPTHEFVERRKAQIARELGTAGRIIVRASGTEDVVRVWVESEVPGASTWANAQLLEAVTTARDSHINGRPPAKLAR